MNLVFPDNFLLTLSYDGSDFYGWAIQKDKITVGNLFKDIFDDLFVQYTWSVAGRTDRGVHAHGQVVSVSTELKLPFEKLKSIINKRLPASVYVRDTRRTTDYMDIRRMAKHRTYKYFIEDRSIYSPHSSRYRHYAELNKIDWDIIRKGAGLFVGEHDFFNFSSSGGSSHTYTRNIHHLKVSLGSKKAIFTVRANAFLYNMVRRIVGTLLELGYGKMDIAFIEELLNSKDKRNKTVKVPPNGLFLWGVAY